MLAKRKLISVNQIVQQIFGRGVHYFTFFAYRTVVKFVKMLALINRILDWIKSLFWKEEMELTLVGLQYSGKTTFVNVIAVSII